MKKLLLTFFILLLALISYIIFSPKPVAMLIHYLFKDGVAVAPSNFDQLQGRTTSTTNISYRSHYKDGTFDLIVPKNNQQNLPVILWIHGGAFVGGDKKDITTYATMLAEKGYAVASINYELAPSAHYPTPLLQINEAYTFLKEHAQTYQLDLSQFFIAGDSAGAQMAAQFAAINTDSSYAKLMNIPAVIEQPLDLKAALLFCGIYDLNDITALGGDAKWMTFLLDRIGWAYIGEKDWRTHDLTKTASIVDYVTSSFPASFVTDGTTNTFTSSGEAFAKKLINLNVPTTALFYKKDADLPHEYQFMLNKKEAQQTFNRLVQFLDARSVDKTLE